VSKRFGTSKFILNGIRSDRGLVLSWQDILRAFSAVRVKEKLHISETGSGCVLVREDRA
jgi:hypothetical protein